MKKSFIAVVLFALVCSGVVCAFADKNILTVSESNANDANPLTTWKAGTVVSAEEVRAFGIDNCFKVESVSDDIFARMKGKSYPDGCNVNRSDLRYIKALHVDKDGRILLGEMVCNKAIANDVKNILRQLYDAEYPIERMVLIDNYDANDEKSMSDNNSSSFCYRAVNGTNVLSKHSLGLAVDINTRYNPCVSHRNGVRRVEPANGEPYTDRSKKFPYKIVEGDLCHRLFTAKGFKWGGSWRTVKDYQHFEK